MCFRQKERTSSWTSFFFFQLNNNKIPDLNALEPQLKHLTSFETIYLEGNPCQQSEGASYRRKIMLSLPQVKQIDATCVLYNYLRFRSGC